MRSVSFRLILVWYEEEVESWCTITPRPVWGSGGTDSGWDTVVTGFHTYT